MEITAYNVTEWLGSEVSGSLRALLETKHLYQSLRIGADQLKEKVGDEELREAIDRALHDRWHAGDEISRQRPDYACTPDGMPLPPTVDFLVEHIKSICSMCKERGPFEMLRTYDLFMDREREWRSIEYPRDQKFAFVMQCQSCRGIPDVFLVQRRGLKITLAGRSPMELLDVPSFIPKEVRRWYSNAIVAFQSGQVLPAIFLLRVLIEQFCKHKLEASEKFADELLAQYMASLPEDFNSRFPSLRDIYSRLSEAIHDANGSTEVFESSVKGLEKHFDARRVYEL